MSRFLVTIHGTADREKAARWCMAAKTGMRVEFKEAKRSGEQNDKLWAMLTEVAAQVPWHGIKLTPDDWKFIFLDALKRELRMVPNIDGTGFVNLGRSSSDLSKSEMSDLIELIHAFGASHGVAFKDTDSISSQPTQAQAEADTPASELAPPSLDAGTLSESSDPAPDDEAQAGATNSASGAGLPSTLPEGWCLLYAAALRRAQKKESLPKLAKAFWATYGGWDAVKVTDARDTAVAIFDAFDKNFGDREQIEAILRELI